MTARKVKMLAAAPFLGAAMVALCAAQAAAQLNTPLIACGGTTDQPTIEISFSAGSPSGAPAGFSIQWMTKDEFDANNGWYLSSDERLCKGSFSGSPCTKKTACVNRFSLANGEATSVELGDLADEELGLSSNCLGDLVCGTDYVIRAFSHATSGRKRSAFTPDLECSTLPCQLSLEGCTFTQGYWKNHPEAWPVGSVALGERTYTQAELLAIFAKAAAGNGLIALAHQLTTARLNEANGADATAIAVAMATADTLIGNKVVPPIGSGSLTNSETSSLRNLLSEYNEGGIGPGHCD